MTPKIYYQQQLSAGLIKEDSQQAKVIAKLDAIHQALTQKQLDKKNGLRRLITPWLASKPVKGLYVWGSVGVGKTFLMDNFFSCLSCKKLRIHFHAFMQRIHDQLTQLQGQPNPLKLVARQLASDTDVLCFDEFFVSDIADAMILAELFKALFAEGICLVTTSNIAPDGLYQYGLQRERFLPAIELIKANTDVMHMIAHHDYRLDHAEQAHTYYMPLNADTDAQMATTFAKLTNNATVNNRTIKLLDRDIATINYTDNVIWFDFKDICGRPRSSHDYLAIAKQYQTILISNVPVLQANQLDLTTSFINLIDIFYDNHKHLILSAEKHVEELYPEGKLSFEFARTQSRLIEMQSNDYVENC